MKKDLKLLSDFIVYSKYANFIPSQNRRETWNEIVERNKAMHLEKFPYLKREIISVYDDFVLPKKVLPSMRSLQFAGTPIFKKNSRIYNCSYLPIDSVDAFKEIMFLLLTGTGVGFSVQNIHISKLPKIKGRMKKFKERTRRKFIIPDSIEGWCDALDNLIRSYLDEETPYPVFDYSEIRPKGSLISSGGKAPGYEPLKNSLTKIDELFSRFNQGDRLSDVDVYDIVCHVADCVISGGVRRSALICLFDVDSEAMMNSKRGEFWKENPQRFRSNNSAVIDLSKSEENIKEQIDFIFKNLIENKTGEPGFFFTNNKDWGTNPCAEIGLRPNQFCNLTTVNFSNVKSQQDLIERTRAAAFIGTLQSAYTDFTYLRPIWKQNALDEPLLGVSMTGLARTDLKNFDLSEAAREALKTNEEYAERVFVKPAARVTCVKPEGTSSLVLGTSSGIHSQHSPYYIRRVRVNKTEPIYEFFLKNYPFVEDDLFDKNSAVVSFPIESPKFSLFRDEPIEQMLDRICFVNETWVKTGHRSGDNYHNVSATVSVKNDREWEIAKQWVMREKKTVSFLPHFDYAYLQAPFEEIDETVYRNMVKEIDYDRLTFDFVETENNVNLFQELACAGGSCEIM